MCGLRGCVAHNLGDAVKVISRRLQPLYHRRGARPHSQSQCRLQIRARVHVLAYGGHVGQEEFRGARGAVAERESVPNAGSNSEQFAAGGRGQKSGADSGGVREESAGEFGGRVERRGPIP